MTNEPSSDMAMLGVHLVAGQGVVDDKLAGHAVDNQRDRDRRRGIPRDRSDVGRGNPEQRHVAATCLVPTKRDHQLGFACGRDDDVGADGLQGRLHVGGGGKGALLRIH